VELRNCPAASLDNAGGSRDVRVPRECPQRLVVRRERASVSSGQLFRKCRRVCRASTLGISFAKSYVPTRSRDTTAAVGHIVFEIVETEPFRFRYHLFVSVHFSIKADFGTVRGKGVQSGTGHSKTQKHFESDAHVSLYPSKSIYRRVSPY
jgi:hypothetical protein